MEIKSVSNPRYSRPDDKTAIDVDMVIENPNGTTEVVQFTATPDDPGEYGRIIYEKALAELEK